MEVSGFEVLLFGDCLLRIPYKNLFHLSPTDTDRMGTSWMPCYSAEVSNWALIPRFPSFLTAAMAAS